ncbi:MAG: sugar phosphate nucleotidyltransferase [Candidatus Krumholzibacteria bacterium]|jgi:glucose-1-phosphate thymidylyltransferase|nr:sugar phosphate nucleotidyltransferase [Candidatus Krumholzibacteria bacterium]MDP6669954.1 sugar phosphate nucleotidyltransferase [Candidatus Krumholzibacteria bacterium]MDP6797717.1 sugar phosphate nucleotidyltransferase [Candidatus Krumholzibacteria bacterium]MDP7020828.1 sugar phosphate nucleotidyltransferase [Candidatus Krumholzibacteria bacterium]
MKGIILAGGTGSRLFPLTKVTNKHLLPVGTIPMILHPLRKMVEAGIEEILIVTGTEHMGDVVALLGSGTAESCQLTYRVQDEAGGIAQALSLAENFCHGESMCVILGDNIFEDSLQPSVNAFHGQSSGARILLKEVPDPCRFGVAELEGDRVVGIEEKPSEPKSSFAVCGIYFFDARVFEIIRTLRPSSRGELEVSDVNNAYIQSGELSYGYFKGWWTDAGTFESYRQAQELLFSERGEEND